MVPSPPQVTDLLLATTPILETWGNSNMPRNPDSSRFGKLYKINFSKRDHSITGCLPCHASNPLYAPTLLCILL